MDFTEDEKQSLKKMIVFLAKKRYRSSGGHSGFDSKIIDPILQELVQDGVIELRPTINKDQYFLK